MKRRRLKADIAEVVERVFYLKIEDQVKRKRVDFELQWQEDIFRSFDLTSHQHIVGNVDGGQKGQRDPKEACGGIHIDPDQKKHQVTSCDPRPCL